VNDEILPRPHAWQRREESAWGAEHANELCFVVTASFGATASSSGFASPMRETSAGGTVKQRLPGTADGGTGEYHLLDNIDRPHGRIVMQEDPGRNDSPR